MFFSHTKGIAMTRAPGSSSTKVGPKAPVQVEVNDHAAGLQSAHDSDAVLKKKHLERGVIYRSSLRFQWEDKMCLRAVIPNIPIEYDGLRFGYFTAEINFDKKRQDQSHPHKVTEHHVQGLVHTVGHKAWKSNLQLLFRFFDTKGDLLNDVKPTLLGDQQFVPNDKNTEAFSNKGWLSTFDVDAYNGLLPQQLFPTARHMRPGAVELEIVSPHRQDFDIPNYDRP
jgi:hypothetical protein